MHFFFGLLLFLITSILLGSSDAQCVLDIGTVSLSLLLDCAFRKSVLLRVRNLGGVKGYVEAGLSIGDSGGFNPDSYVLTKRRSPSVGFNGKFQKKQVSDNTITGAPSSRPQGEKASLAFRSMLQAATSHFQNLPSEVTSGDPDGKKRQVQLSSDVTLAPRDYHPVGYNRNNSGTSETSKWPKTSFSCEQQKHFPGLYADQELGCKVFRACALTDAGLIMKSFLCPESTLFDQTILKCNWWFYVDCKASSKLYDSNIPFSKSFQLLKILSPPAATTETDDLQTNYNHYS